MRYFRSLPGAAMQQRKGLFMLNLKSLVGKGSVFTVRPASATPVGPQTLVKSKGSGPGLYAC